MQSRTAPRKFSAEFVPRNCVLPVMGERFKPARKFVLQALVAALAVGLGLWCPMTGLGVLDNVGPGKKAGANARGNKSLYQFTGLYFHRNIRL